MKIIRTWQDFNLSVLVCTLSVFLSLVAEAQEVPFSRGINLTQWFQVSSPGEIQFSRYTYKDFEQIQSLGCDVIRLPINLHAMTDGGPEYRLDPLFTRFLDEVIGWAEELGLFLILDNHTFDPLENTSPDIEPILVGVWSQMASRYADRSDYILYEILNEPHGIRDDVWNEIQKSVIDTIRHVDDKHTIVVGGSGFNSYHNLQLIPDLGDDNLIYTFHFYDPFLFTHQGATWVEPSMDPIEGVPFPFNAMTMPGIPGSVVGTWVQTLFINYMTEGREERVRELIDIAINFRDQRQLPVYCGEFGVHIPNSNQDDRVHWYQVVREYLEANGIPWTTWDYHGGFGLYEDGGNGQFHHDLNVDLLEALGLEGPPQTVYVTRPDSVGFPIYTDLVEEDILSDGHGGQQNFYQTQDPNYGSHCIEWKDAGQYNAIGFDFTPDRDLHQLVEEGYAIDLFVKSSQDQLAFDLRFMDTKTDADDKPWRMHYRIDDSQVQWDGNWQHLHIPLAAFTEHGAWDNGWFEPQGLFDWTAIDRLEISTEYGGINGFLQIDHLVITNQDTATVQTTTGTMNPDNEEILNLYPNPAYSLIQLDAGVTRPVPYQIVNILGGVMQQGVVNGRQQLDLTAYPPGPYFIHAQVNNSIETHKFMKL